jgi:hypothetical protein
MCAICKVFARRTAPGRRVLGLSVAWDELANRVERLRQGLPTVEYA